MGGSIADDLRPHFGMYTNKTKEPPQMLKFALEAAPFAVNCLPIQHAEGVYHMAKPYIIAKQYNTPTEEANIIADFDSSKSAQRYHTENERKERNRFTKTDDHDVL